ncbi:hypothetical protein Y032_0228g2881 [Ancylostoma ceylanicum]|uniref:Uncharacterized protein n=1 Tax=Ancylostoma ceylanicum TaxID=53326 RepID=A0A016SHB9_9BILA|nr:hypothetical protein Y032_0228g2881 [Ancylostoma ceylanicum]
MNSPQAKITSISMLVQLFSLTTCKETQHYLQNNRNDFMLVAMLPQLLRDVMLANGIFKGEIEVITAKFTILE